MNSQSISTQNHILHAHGAGRDPRTKAERRLNRFAERTFNIGEVVIRPGRRVPLTVGFLAGHAELVVGHMKRGALRLEQTSDRAVTVEEFLELAKGSLPEALAPLAEPVPVDQTPPPLPEHVQPIVPMVRPAHMVAEAARMTQESSAAAAAANGPGDGSDEAGGDEGSQEEGSDVELAGDQDKPLLTNEDEPGDEPLPAVLAPVKELPAGWRNQSKKALLVLCMERKIEDASDKLSNRDLVSKLEAWEKATKG